MCFFASLIPATFFLILGYFVLFASARSEDGIRTFGQILAVWIFVIAAAFPITGAVVALYWECPMEKMMESHTLPPTG